MCVRACVRASERARTPFSQSVTLHACNCFNINLKIKSRQSDFNYTIFHRNPQCIQSSLCYWILFLCLTTRCGEMTVTALELPSRMRTEVAFGNAQTYGFNEPTAGRLILISFYSTDQICILSFVLLLALLFALHTP